MQQALSKKIRVQISFSSRTTITICLILLLSIIKQSFILYINWFFKATNSILRYALILRWKLRGKHFCQISGQGPVDCSGTAQTENLRSELESFYEEQGQALRGRYSCGVPGRQAALGLGVWSEWVEGFHPEETRNILTEQGMNKNLHGVILRKQSPAS